MRRSGVTKQTFASCGTDLSKSDFRFLLPGSSFNVATSIAGVSDPNDAQIYSLQEFDQQERLDRPKEAFFARVAKKLQTIECNRKKLKKAAFKILPCIRTVKNYNLKQDIVPDLVCGFTIGLVNIPLSMAYALLYFVPAVYSLYGGFIPVLLYAILGTSNHVSYGTLAITALLVGNSVKRILPLVVPSEILHAVGAPGNYSDFVDDFLDESGYATPEAYVQNQQVSIVLVISFWAGVIQLLIGVFRLGNLTIYLADAMVAGYTTATVLFVFASQLKSLLGLSFESPTGYLNFFKTFYQVFSHIGETNLVTLLISFISIATLAFFKFFINPILIRKIRAPLPIEVVLVIVAIILSAVLDLKNNYYVKVVGKLKLGLPPPILPDLSLTGYVLQDSIVIGIVNYGVTFSLAQVLANKYAYALDVNQEAIAYGISSIVGSFFQCVVTGGSVSRTGVQETMKARSQLVGFISSLIMVIVLLTVAHLFSPLPLAVLASIIAVGLFGLVEQFKEPYRLWYISRYDCLIWLGTFISTILLDVDIGLLVGLLFSFFVVVLRTQTPESHLLGVVPGTDLFKNTVKYKNACEIPSLKIYRFGGPIHFANSSAFRAQLFKHTGVNPGKMLIEKNKLLRKKKIAETELEKSTNAEKREKLLRILSVAEPSTPINYIILDLSTCPYIDYGGLRLLKQTISEYKRVGVTMLLSACPSKVRNILLSTDFYKEYEQTVVYLSVKDAVLAAVNDLPKNPSRVTSSFDITLSNESLQEDQNTTNSSSPPRNEEEFNGVCTSNEAIQQEAISDEEGRKVQHTWH